MKKTLLLLVFLSGFAFAQQNVPTSPTPGESAHLPPVPQISAETPQQLMPVSHSDKYCPGFISKVLLPRTKFVAGGITSPHTTKFVDRDFIFLEGSDYQPGTRVSIVRELRDPNRFHLFTNQQQLLEKTGQPYADIGYAVIVEIRGDKKAVAQMEFTCEPAVPGDLVIPFVPKPDVSYRLRSQLDRFPTPHTALSGRIVMARDFDQFVGTGRKVYLNVGSEKGVKVGDYFRVVRTYEAQEMDEADATSILATSIEDTQKNAPSLPKKRLKQLPKRVLGEVIILDVTPTSASAMVTFAMEEIHVGDPVELEEGQTGIPPQQKGTK